MTYSIIQKSQFEGAKRIDAEYYQPEHLELGKQLRRLNSQSLSNYIEYLTDGAHQTPDYQNEGILFLSSGLIHENYIDFDNAKFISNIEDHKLIHCKPKLNDVLISKSGNIGVSTVFNHDINCNLFEGVALLRAKKINPYFLATFLNSKIGQSQIKRLTIGISQPHLHLEQIENIRVFLPLENDQKMIEKVYLKSISLIQISNEIYQQAENLLLEELGLRDYKIEDELSCVVNYSDIKTANRVDAEYFQPKYEKLISIIKSQNSNRLGEIVSMKKGIEPGSEVYQEQGKLFMRVSSLSKFGIDKVDQKYLSDDLYQKLKKDFEPQIGEILLTKDATPGIAYVLKEPLESIISGGVLRLKLNQNIELEYLALCMNSLIGQMQAEKDAGGSIIVQWK